MLTGVIRNSNFTFAAPPSMPDCQDLRVRVTRDPEDGKIAQISSAWYPTPEEVALLIAGEPVVLTVWGGGMPPVSLWVDKP